MRSDALHVLVLADQCNPDWASLPNVTYNACKALSCYVNLTVATHVRNRESLAAEGLEAAQIVYLNNEYIAAPLYKLGTWLRGGSEGAWTTAIALLYPAHLAFEWEVWKRFKEDLRSRRFDVVHRMTPMSPAIPSPIARKTPVPFVLGPLNGGLPWPRAFTAELRREREQLTYLRNLYRHLPFHDSTYRQAAVILAAFQHTIDDLPVEARSRAVDFPEVGIDPSRFSYAGPRPLKERVEFLFVGRLVPYKCPDVVVAAFAQNPALRRHRLRIVGDGPERPRLETQVAKAGLSSCVEFAGWKTQAEVATIMAQADVFAFPSIRELGAGVVLQAMACGCVPLVVDYGGPSGLVTSECGIRVPLTDKSKLIESFARAMEEMAENRAHRDTLARAAHERAVSEFSWDAKARRLHAIYERVVAEARG